MTNLVQRAPVRASVAGFDVWLTYRSGRIPVRGSTVRAVSRFLTWQREQRIAQSDHTEDAYCRDLCGQGAEDYEVDAVRGAIALFRRYLHTAD